MTLLLATDLVTVSSVLLPLREIRVNYILDTCMFIHSYCSIIPYCFPVRITFNPNIFLSCRFKVTNIIGHER